MQLILITLFFTLSKVLVFSQIMNRHVSRLLTTHAQDENISNILNSLQTQLHTRFNILETHPLYADTCILDPRFKKKGFRTQEAFHKAIEILRRRLAREKMPTTNAVEAEEEPQQQEATHTKTDCIWDEFDAEMGQITHPENSVAAGIRELDKYLGEEYLHRKEDPLKWWHSRKNIYPHIYQLVLKQLCIQATSVSCERVVPEQG